MSGGGGPVGPGAVRNLVSLYGANGEYNKRKGSENGLVDFASAKRVRSEFFPAGKFNDTGAGPTSVLADKGNDRASMAKNLATNQTEKTLYINIPRFIVPLILPSGHSGAGRKSMALAKSIVAGDVVFHLRYNNHMIENSTATTVPAKSVGSSACFAANLQTVNYILAHLHRHLDAYRAQMLGTTGHYIGNVGAGAPQAHAVARTAFLGAITGRTLVLTNEPDEDMKTWRLFFYNISRGSGIDAFSELLSETSQATGQSFFAKWFDKMRQREFATNSPVARSEREFMLEKYVSRMVWEFVRTYIKIAGVFIGSDYQGGNDQGDPNPCSFLSTDYTGTIQVAGKSLKVKNMWSSQTPGVRGGDIIGFRLVHCAPRSGAVDFHLSSNPAVAKSAGLKVRPEVAGEQTLRPLMLMPCVMGRRAHAGPGPGPGYSVCTHAPHFLQFGVSNQISKLVAGTVRELEYCTNALAATQLMNIEVFLRFNVLDTLGDDMHAARPALARPDEERIEFRRPTVDSSRAHVPAPAETTRNPDTGPAAPPPAPAPPDPVAQPPPPAQNRTRVRVERPPAAPAEE